MKVLARNKLTDFMRKHASSKKALEAWYAEAERSNWQTPQDIKNRFASADFLADNRVIFNIKGNHFRLVVKVRYQGGIVVVEWVGTHADYSKQKL
ncbi:MULTISPECIES: type II toxin-antitoxin system HigB family toxin [Marinobacter]|uniref:Type II toxin-antitoxin system HigB family toxin n=1 Tax=Marinobacter metalliresistant TaxID=2961995 RepID=A0ABZ2W6T6_9GAMM|nr:type II toxin-antitoxin system HigB family toxin [Marinobacter sp. Arc7-DN-1]AXS83174.1 type II toxin-antitoxin system HigB family toxin [Marinobacter sp. Arc7-DN-1]